jgi:ribonuclease E
MKRILINATHEEELRIAIARGQYLEDLIIESTTREQKQSNIYKGRITRIEPSLEAAFVDYGENRHGFLPLKEIARSCFRTGYDDNGRRLAINDVLDENQELILQVKKEERDLKGAALTTFISLPGCYLVLMPNNPRAGGISRRIDDEERDQSHEILSQLKVPDGMGVILRTAGSGRNLDELQWDLDILLKQWEAISQVTQERPAPFLIYQEGNAVIRTLRDYLRKDIDEILIDDHEVYEQSLNHLKLIRPDYINCVKPYKDPTPLFTRFQIESQIESAFQREVRLPSGGSIVIDRTEALVSIDINSSKATKGGDIEETALTTNLEAADEVARQLRLRDIGGLIVIDFIDMSAIRNQREVEDRLKNALAIDRARVQIGRISRFGLLEMSRQRLRPSLGESSQITCPRCLGQGSIRGIESLGLSVIRLIEEEALKENTAQVRAILPIEIATYILNEKRQAIIDIEKRQNLSVIVVANAHMDTPQYRVERIRNSDAQEDSKTPSYKLTLDPEAETAVTVTVQKVAQEPAIKTFITQATAIPAPAPRESGAVVKTATIGHRGLFKKLFTYLFSKKEITTAATEEKKPYRMNSKRPLRQHSSTQRRGGGRFQQQQRGRGGNRRPNRQGRPFESRRPSDSDERHKDNRDSREHHVKTSDEHRERDHHRDRDNHEKDRGEQQYHKAPQAPIPQEPFSESTIVEIDLPMDNKAVMHSTPNEKRMRFYPGQSRRRFEPSKKSAALRRGHLDNKPSSAPEDEGKDK